MGGAGALILMSGCGRGGDRNDADGSGLSPQAVVTAVDDSFYKITSEALLVLHLIVKAIRPLGMVLATPLYLLLHPC